MKKPIAAVLMLVLLPLWTVAQSGNAAAVPLRDAVATKRVAAAYIGTVHDTRGDVFGRAATRYKNHTDVRLVRYALVPSWASRPTAQITIYHGRSLRGGNAFHRGITTFTSAGVAYRVVYGRHGAMLLAKTGAARDTFRAKGPIWVKTKVRPRVQVGNGILRVRFPAQALVAPRMENATTTLHLVGGHRGAVDRTGTLKVVRAFR